MTITYEEISEELSISKATIKNWIVTNKIPYTVLNNKITFTKDDFNQIKKIVNETNLLTRRRNKTKTKGIFLYEKYLNKNSPNIENVQFLQSYFENKEITLTKEYINYILCDCFLKLYCEKHNIKHSNILIKFLNKEISFQKLDLLLNEFIDNKKRALEFINKNQDLFEINYNFVEKEDLAGCIYQSLSFTADKKKNGAYYTPSEIVKKSIQKLNEIKIQSNAKILDPCCGTGNFLLNLTDKTHVNQIFGYDIDKTSIDITRLNLVLKYGNDNIDTIKKNIQCKNYLLDKTSDIFDIIIGNPPWGYKFNKQEKEIYTQKFSCTSKNNIESFSIVIEKSLDKLKNNGLLLFILPQSILNAKSHSGIRNIIQKNTKCLYTEYLGEIFQNVQCPSIMFFVKKSKQNFYNNCEIKTKNNSYYIKSNRCNEIFTFNITDEEYEILEKISKNDNNFLKDNCDFALGIVTGNNLKYITNTKSIENEPILKGSDIKKYRINYKNNFINYSPIEFQQVANEKLYRAKEKLVYKFISNKLVFAYDDKQTLTLNSCNIIIPNKKFNIKYVLAILNSSIVQFIFSKKYNSIKVLRNHIENMPIPNATRHEQSDIINIVEKLLENFEEDTFNKLDKKIAKLYKLTQEEFNYIKNCK